MRKSGRRCATAGIAAALLTCVGCTQAQGDKESADAVIPKGTVLTVALDDPLSTELSLQGDRFRATLLEPVRGTYGTALPAGARASGLIIDLIQPGKETSASLTMNLVSVESSEGNVLDVTCGPLSLVAAPDGLSRESGGAPAETITGAPGPEPGTTVIVRAGDKHVRLVPGGRLQFRLEEPALIRPVRGVL